MPELIEPLPFDDAIEFFRQKGYRLSQNGWRDVWAAEHVQAFTVARVTAMDVLEDIRKAVDRALEEGVSLGKFREELAETLRKKGWLGRDGIAPWRLETIYRTNLQSAYQAGRYRQMLEVAPRRPYWMYDAVEDMRTRPAHAAQDGKVYRFDHPFWDTWYPPNGFNCFPAGTLVLTALGWRPIESIGLQDGVIGASLNRFRDGLVETGIPATRMPLRLLLDERTHWRGWANYASGEIGLCPNIYRTTERVLQQGAAMLAEEVDDLKTVVHEFGHQVGFPLDVSRYETDRAYYALSQAVNDLWARHVMGEWLRALGIRYSEREVRRVVASHPSGYQAWVQRLRGILSAARMSDAEQKELLTRLNLTVRPEDFSREIWREITVRRPRVTQMGEIGEVLLEEERYQWLLGELVR